MTRNLKMLGLTAIAALAMAAVMASAASANFTSENYPATGSASSTGDTFTAFGSEVQCTDNSFSGELAAASPELTISPSYNDCTYGVFPATVDFNECDYLFETTTPSPQVNVECAGSSEIEINVFASHAAHTAGTPICVLSVPEQGPLTGHTYTNNVNGTVTISGTVGNVTATQVRNSFVCPAGTHTPTAEYEIQAGGIVVSGDNGAIEAH